MNKVFIILSLIITVPYLLMPASNDQSNQEVPSAPALPPAPVPPAYVFQEDDLPQKEYDYCMEITKLIDPKMHAHLLRAEKLWAVRCFKKNVKCVIVSLTKNFNRLTT